MTGTENPAQDRAKRRLAVVVTGSLAGVAIGLAAVYGITTFLRNRAGDAQCAPAVATAGRVAPLARGEVAGVVVASRPVARLLKTAGCRLPQSSQYNCFVFFVVTVFICFFLSCYGLLIWVIEIQ